jgi:hypothetical protein
MHKIWIFFSGVLCFALFGGGSNAQAQKPSKKMDYSKQPYWIEMMNDSSVNYFEAVKAFKVFWKDRKEPSEENEMKEHAQGKKEDHESRLGKVIHAKEIKLDQESEKYSLEYKKFLHWKMITEPYVQPDGHILSKSERLEIWKKQRQ